VAKLFFWAVILTLPLTQAATITYTSTTNPASVTATLNAPCDKVYENLEKLAGKIFGDIPFVSDARVMGDSDWKESSTTTTSTTSKKSLNLSITSTLTKEFPTTFLPVQVERTICNPKRDPSASCTDYYTLTFNGTQAVIYKTVVEGTSTDDWANSFSGAMTLTADGSDSCKFVNSLSIVDNSYLWAKRHMIKDLNPNLVEGRILTEFTNWSKNILPTMEGK
jgi:hypothetical protein